MEFEFTEEQQAIKAMAADFAAERIAPFAAAWDRDCTFPVDVLRHAAALGFATMFVSEAHGGSGLTRLDGAIVFEELSRACPSTAAYISIHNMVAGMIERFGTPAQHEAHLPALATMERLSAYCLTEPNAGSDAASLTTRARRDGDDYVIDGAKAFISGGGRADLYVVMTRTGGAGAGGVTALLVEAGTKGLSFGAQEEKMGWHSQPTAAVMFDECRVPAENRLGEEGDGFKIAMTGLDGGRINIGACSLGAGAAALDHALHYAGGRQQFGRPIADFQATQFKLADMRTELEAARLLLHKAASAVERRTPDATPLAAMAKRLATDTGFAVVNTALQIHGGYGYLRDYPLERLLRDVRVHQILEGTNEIMRVIIARHLLRASSQ
ncbi:acyl-CoA dehydrogenase family protein [Acuticoccus sp. MNP-M23]|uniref:acyl-CoA dehydrogenase family protein n=1 Tax=Acuticoccus sp. MNP-M23 TaxID=3072793 RepID=UPI002815BAFF|nr:acyl-CoA dehydrogenase family protein [Acuticoccus sp. MNP-M23]WMS42470.1 acyl-CoA dehydrogenase family protein [Acuticoccus sp. MNP-M23]